MAETIVYPVGDGLYVNLTNKCSCACAFCVRQKAPGVGKDAAGETNDLWLDHEPSFEEAMAAFEGHDMSRCKEVVFCGFGEPTYALETLEQVAREAKRRWGVPVRVDTNGQGSLIWGRDIVPGLAAVADAVSVSLNAPDAQAYQRVSRSVFGEQAFEAVLAFAREARELGLAVTMTTVATTISHEEEGRCRAICEELGARYRIRGYIE